MPPKGDIDHLIILDRNVDFMTPLCTQLILGGLIDDFYGIKNNVIMVEPAALGIK
jgi:hypothetical protein